MPLANIELPLAALGEFCHRWKITELAVFGSVLHDDFGPDSDIDFLATYAPDARRSLLDEFQMHEELETLLGRRVDLVSRRAVEESPNWIRREAILDSAESVYAESR